MNIFLSFENPLHQARYSVHYHETGLSSFKSRLLVGVVLALTQMLLSVLNPAIYIHSFSPDLSAILSIFVASLAVLTVSLIGFYGLRSQRVQRHLSLVLNSIPFLVNFPATILFALLLRASMELGETPMPFIMSQFHFFDQGMFLGAIFLLDYKLAILFYFCTGVILNFVLVDMNYEFF